MIYPSNFTSRDFVITFESIKTSEKQRFSEVFRGYQKRLVA